MLGRERGEDGVVGNWESPLPQPNSADDGESGPSRDARGRFVPHAALHRERLARKEAEAEKAKLAETYSAAQARLQQIEELIKASMRPPQQEQQQQYQPDPNEFVDPEQDVFENVKQIQKQLLQQKRVAESQSLHNAYQDDALSFARERNDFPAAYKFLSESLDAELKIQGANDPRERSKILLQRERAFAQSCLRSGRSPSEMLYQLAQNRGFRGGQGPAPMPSPAHNPAADRLQQQGQAMQAMASLTRTGSPPGATLSVENLANMSDAEFTEVVTKLGGMHSDKFKSMFGA